MKLTNDSDLPRDYPTLGVFGVEPGESVTLPESDEPESDEPEPAKPRKRGKKQPQDQHDQADEAATPEES